MVYLLLYPETPREGRALTDLFKGRSEEEMQVRAMKGPMIRKACLTATVHTYNSRLAQEIGAWADTQEGGEVMHDALYKAYFVDAKNISEPDILLEIVEANGLSVEKARLVLEQRSFKDAVDEDWRKSHQYGVTGVPTFVASGHAVVGAQRAKRLRSSGNCRCRKEGGVNDEYRSQTVNDPHGCRNLAPISPLADEDVKGIWDAQSGGLSSSGIKTTHGEQVAFAISATPRSNARYLAMSTAILKCIPSQRTDGIHATAGTQEHPSLDRIPRRHYGGIIRPRSPSCVAM